MARTAAAPANDVVVTALIMAYNHERLVEQAIESALLQELDVGYEILIADDCSTETTRSIVQRYGERHPDRIRLFLPEQNMGENAMRVAGTRAARGTYIAFLDGDDYWTSPRKLQRQAEFLSERPDYAICFHNALVVYDDGSVAPHPFHSENPTQRLSRGMPPDSCGLEEIAPGNFMQLSSVMFRNRLVHDFPPWYFQAKFIPDWAFHVLHASTA
jgi:glycosyltransferase involved in cell wall biosynthesis